MLLPITEDLREELIRWFIHYAEVMGLDGPKALPNTWTLVPSARFIQKVIGHPELGGRYVYRTDSTYHNFEKIVKDALVKLGLPTHGEGFHTLRRSMGRVQYDMMCEDKVSDPIRVVMAQLGHKKRETTERYLGVSHEERLRDDVMKGKSFLKKAAQQRRDARETQAQLGHRDQKVTDIYARRISA
jgi:integrase